MINCSTLFSNKKVSELGSEEKALSPWITLGF